MFYLNFRKQHNYKAPKNLVNLFDWFHFGFIKFNSTSFPIWMKSEPIVYKLHKSVKPQFAKLNNESHCVHIFQFIRQF